MWRTHSCGALLGAACTLVCTRHVSLLLSCTRLGGDNCQPRVGLSGASPLKEMPLLCAGEFQKRYFKENWRLRDPTDVLTTPVGMLDVYAALLP